MLIQQLTNVFEVASRAQHSQSRKFFYPVVFVQSRQDPVKMSISFEQAYVLYIG